MFAATDTSWAPWYVARSDDKRKARLNIIRHFLSQIRYEDVERKKVKLPKRKIDANDGGETRMRFIPELY
jgi:hypothetical protein